MKKAKRVVALRNKLHLNSIRVLLLLALFLVIGIFGTTRIQAGTGPDLIVSDVTMNPATPQPGQATTFSATLTNQGEDPIAAGTVIGVSFAIDGQQVTWNKTNTQALAAGASVTLTADAGTSGATWAATAGGHTLVATADPDNAVAGEFNENNNTKNLAFSVGASGKLYTTPETLTTNNGETFDLAVRVTPQPSVDGVEAILNYDTTKLEFVSTVATGTAFELELGPQGGTAGKVTLTRGSFAAGGITSDALVAIVKFKALATSGNTTVQMDGNTTKAGAYTNPTKTNTVVSFGAPGGGGPVTSITAPANGANVSGNQTITAAASSDKAITRVEFYIDGQLKNTDEAAPYAYILDTKTLTNAAHTLRTKVYDADNNTADSATITINVQNYTEDINRDGVLDLLDLAEIIGKFGQNGTNLGNADINGDGVIDLLDFSLFARKYSN